MKDKLEADGPVNVGMGPSCRVDRSACGVVFLTVGPTTVRLTTEVFEQVANTVMESLFRLQCDLAPAPVNISRVN